MSSECKGKDSWPELVGKQGKVAEEIIERENPLVNAIIVDEDSSVTLDYRCDRVWVWVNKSGDKTLWPELVGTQGDVAVAIIKTEDPNLKVLTLFVNSIVTAELNCNRVRVYVDANDTVAKVPKLG